MDPLGYSVSYPRPRGDALGCLSREERNAVIIAARPRSPGWEREVATVLGWERRRSTVMHEYRAPDGRRIRESSAAPGLEQMVLDELERIKRKIRDAAARVLQRPTEKQAPEGRRKEAHVAEETDPLEGVKEKAREELAAVEEALQPLQTQRSRLIAALAALDGETPPDPDEKLDEKEREEEPSPEEAPLREKIKEEAKAAAASKKQTRAKTAAKRKAPTATEQYPTKNDVWDCIRHDKDLKGGEKITARGIGDRLGLPTAADRARIGDRLRQIAEDGKLKRTGGVRGPSVGYFYVRPEDRPGGAGDVKKSNGGDPVPGVGSEAPRRGAPVPGTGADGRVGTTIV